MESKSDIEGQLICKLVNSLKGSALLVRESNDKMMIPEERLEHMRVIGDFLNYIKDYNKNKNKRIIEEYKDIIERQINDGR